MPNISSATFFKRPGPESRAPLLPSFALVQKRNKPLNGCEHSGAHVASWGRVPRAEQQQRPPVPNPANLSHEAHLGKDHRAQDSHADCQCKTSMLVDLRRRIEHAGSALTPSRAPLLHCAGRRSRWPVQRGAVPRRFERIWNKDTCCNDPLSQNFAKLRKTRSAGAACRASTPERSNCRKISQSFAKQ